MNIVFVVLQVLLLASVASGGLYYETLANLLTKEEGGDRGNRGGGEAAAAESFTPHQNLDFSSIPPHLLNYTRILIIGDSCDRYAVSDWCDRCGFPALKERDIIPNNFTQNQTYFSIFQPYGARRRGWEVRTCECARESVVLSFLFQKFGVKPQGPWHFPLQTSAGLEDVLRPGLRINDVWRLGQYTALAPLARVMGGWPHGVSLSSYFWDLSHPDPEGIRRNHSDIWLKQWKTNATELMQIVKHDLKTLNNDIWLGWRSANYFVPVPEGYHWNTNHALLLLQKMNHITDELAPSLGYKVVNTLRMSSSLRDL